MKEFNLINKYLKPLALNKGVSFGLTEDVAMISDGMVVSKDLFVENVHFLASDKPKDVASRLLLSNISDIAACGALPKYYMLGLPKRQDLMDGFYDEFCQELALIQDQYDISLIGGDTVEAKNDLFFSLTIFGETKSGKILRRNKAKTGEGIFITDSIGGSFLGLEYKMSKSKEKFSILGESDVKEILECHNRPQIPVLFSNALLSSNLSHCAIDISDGLIADLQHICNESNVGARLDLEKIPICEAGKKLVKADLYDAKELISRGEDYRILFTADKSLKNDVFTLANRFKIGLNYIGDIVNEKNRSIKINDANGNNIKLNYFGYEH